MNVTCSTQERNFWNRFSSMGSFIARQPNGLLCRFSTVVDTVTHWNMTAEDYIEYCAEVAREEAKFKLNFIHKFDEVKESFVPENHTCEEFLEILREMGDTETKLEDLNTIEEE